MLDRLNDIEGKQYILTDPVTGYIVSALTPHQTFRHKFYASEYYQAFPFAFEDYSDFPLSRYRGWLLVVNLRDGGHSQAGEISGHWPEDILKVSEYYPSNLLQHLRMHKNNFETVWQTDDITIYRVL